ncbi:C2H2 and C2HC zinc finger [Glarea lozoyensis ATCC 20868]|uniref:C2H2 and C2HC zinc finger n=1 Tax=Glarea lozoyensis (strain ATCC 20868 / MF5171) TaxID=1116229 RepID=S3D841_GLAL2|nr:C2H2 and C2HC zinc finger [Glarea lozoyensis ATCC 20868]EPE28181.1 C2H2 and C2HC zinc finger [Glarea lozoyensis ATCC 20868]
MVSFSCEACGDVLTKKKLDPHRNQCRGASFTCLDCMIHFQGQEYRAHTSCISEAQKYQGALYRPDKKEKNRQNNQNNSHAVVPHSAYVEDAEDEYNQDTQLAVVEAPPPEAPSPPSAAPGYGMSPDPVNVFDFLVTSETPNGSRNELPAPEPMVMIEDVPDESRDRELVRVHFEDYQDVDQSVTDLVQYGSAPIQSQFETPAPKGERERERRRERKDRDLTREEKKDKKRKRLHVETRDLSPKHDEEMTDAPPVLHSGLTGGLNRLLSRPSVFPPSPDYSGGDANDASPGSPLKKTKSSKKRGRSRVDTISNNIMSLISTRREHSSEERPKRKHRKHREASARPSKAKMIEYKPMHENADIKDDSQVVLYKPRSEILLDFVNKGPDSERGMSMHKALKAIPPRAHSVRYGIK